MDLKPPNTDLLFDFRIAFFLFRLRKKEEEMFGFSITSDARHIA